MTGKLFVSAIVKLLAGVVLVGVALFLPAGTLAYVNGWLLMGVLFVPMFLAGIVMMCKDPALLSRRLDAKEKLREQGVVVKLSGLMFLSGFVLAGLGERFAWYTLPKAVSYVFTGVFLFAYLSLCGGASRKHLSFPYHNGGGGADGRGYGTLRHCQTSDVQRDLAFVFVHAPYSWLCVCFCDLSCVSLPHCAAHPKRGSLSYA